MMRDVVELTQRLIGFDTTNPPGGELESLEFLSGLFKAAGFSVHIDEFAPGRGSLVARLNPKAAGRPLCFGGHIDTVPLGRKPWSVPPFSGMLRDGMLIGRGACDMKGGVASMTCAALRLSRALPPSEDLIVHIYGGEEAGCQGSFHVSADPALMGSPGAVIITEPTNNHLLAGHKGALWLEVTTSGRTAHGSMPENGDNALNKALDAAARLRDHDFHVAPHAVLGAPTLAVTSMRAGQNVNSIPDQAVFTLDIRTIPAQTSAAILRELKHILDTEARLRILLDVAPVWTDPQDPWIRKIKPLVAQRTGQDSGVEAVQFFTDASAIRPALPDIPVAIFGPGDPGRAHQTDEACPVEQLRVAEDVYLDIAADWYGLERKPL